MVLSAGIRETAHTRDLIGSWYFLRIGEVEGKGATVESSHGKRKMKGRGLSGWTFGFTNTQRSTREGADEMEFFGEGGGGIRCVGF